MDVAIPPRVATLMRETREEDDSALLLSVEVLIVWVAGPTSLMGAGMLSVMEKIWSEVSGNARRNAQKKGEALVMSSGEYKSSHSPFKSPEVDEACPIPTCSATSSNRRTLSPITCGDGLSSLLLLPLRTTRSLLISSNSSINDVADDADDVTVLYASTSLTLWSAFLFASGTDGRC